MLLSTRLPMHRAPHILATHPTHQHGPTLLPTLPPRATVQLPSLVSMFNNVIQMRDLDMEFATTGLRARAPASFAGLNVTAGLDVFRKGMEVDGEQLRLNLTAANVDLGDAVGRLWGSSPPASVATALRNAVFERLNTQTSKGACFRCRRGLRVLGLPGLGGGDSTEGYVLKAFHVISLGSRMQVGQTSFAGVDLHLAHRPGASVQPCSS